MKKALARDKWDNACETLQEANVLARTGFYKGAISRAFFAMENAARAALALKDQEPRTHSGLIQAFNQQVAGKAGLEESWTSRSKAPAMPGTPRTTAPSTPRPSKKRTANTSPRSSSSPGCGNISPKKALRS